MIPVVVMIMVLVVMMMMVWMVMMMVVRLMLTMVVVMMVVVIMINMNVWLTGWDNLCSNRQIPLSMSRPGKSNKSWMVMVMVPQIPNQRNISSPGRGIGRAEKRRKEG